MADRRPDDAPESRSYSHSFLGDYLAARDAALRQRERDLVRFGSEPWRVEFGR